MRRERCVFVLLLLAPTLLAVGALRPSGARSGVPQAVFFEQKVVWADRYDLVVLGDSTVYRGISPVALEEGLGRKCRVANFGFSGVGYSSIYLQAGRELLAPDAVAPTLLLAVTPHSLLEDAAAASGFTECWGDGRWVNWGKVLSGQVVEFFEPLDLGAVKRLLRGEALTGYRVHYHRDGWAETRVSGRDPEKHLESAHRLFAGQHISERLVSGLASTIAEWRAAGIAVFLFRPPVGEAYRRMESMTGFDERAVKKRLSAVGGVWLAVDETAYECYDGVHLAAPQAVELSRELGRKIVTNWRD